MTITANFPRSLKNELVLVCFDIKSEPVLECDCIV